MMKRPLVFLSILVGLYSTQSFAQDSATIADIRCVLVGIKLSGRPNTSEHYHGALFTWYYIGRLDGRAPKLDIENLLVDEVGKMTDDEFASETKRCAKGLVDRDLTITQIGKHLSERGNKSDPPPTN